MAFPKERTNAQIQKTEETIPSQKFGLTVTFAPFFNRKYWIYEEMFLFGNIETKCKTADQLKWKCIYTFYENRPIKMTLLMPGLLNDRACAFVFLYISQFFALVVTQALGKSEWNKYTENNAIRAMAKTKILQNMTHKSTYAVYLFSMKQQCRMQNFHVCLSPAYKHIHSHTHLLTCWKSICLFACQYPRPSSHRCFRHKFCTRKCATQNILTLLVICYTTEEKATKVAL